MPQRGGQPPLFGITEAAMNAAAAIFPSGPIPLVLAGGGKKKRKKASKKRRKISKRTKRKSRRRVKRRTKK
tara:strand:+ start:2520 stop:2732 length:213 start_codon:yes stop_codon:yes gene_type:complete